MSTLMAQIKQMVLIGGIKQIEVPAVCSFVAAVYGNDVAPGYWLPQVEPFLQHQRVHKVFKDGSVYKLESLREDIERAYTSATITQEEPDMPLADFRITPQVVTIPTGINSLDTRLGGGLGRKEYGILCAYTGVGKTTLGLNFAWGAAQAGYRVAFATLELDKDKIRERLYSCVGRYDYNKIRYGDLTGSQTREEIWEEVRERVRVNAEDSINNLQVWDFSTETCSIQTLEDWIKRDQDRNPDHPLDALYVDWLLCLDERPGFDPRKLADKEMRHRLQRYSDELSKKVARTHNMAVWATHQANDKAEGEDKVSIKHAAEGKSVGWKCSVFLGVGASEEGRAKNYFTCNAGKMRDGRLFTCKIKAMLHEQRFEDYNEAAEAASQIAPVQSDIEAARARQAARQTGSILPPPTPVQ